MTNDSFADLREAFARLDKEIRPLNPLGDGYCAISVSAHGYHGVVETFHVFFGADAVYDASSIEDLKEKIAKRDPVKMKLEKIASMEKQLAALKSETEPATELPTTEAA